MSLSVPNRPSQRLRLAASHGRTEDPTTAPSRSIAGEPDAPSLDDTQLLEAMRRSDVTAAKAFHDRVRGRAERTPVARLLGRGDPDDDDLVQLAVIELVTTISRFRGECSLDTWIAMVTARVVYKHIRKKRSERRLLESVRRQDATSLAPGRVGRDALLRDLAVRLRDHLGQLDPDKAWTFVLTTSAATIFARSRRSRRLGLRGADSLDAWSPRAARSHRERSGAYGLARRCRGGAMTIPRYADLARKALVEVDVAIRPAPSAAAAHADAVRAIEAAAATNGAAAEAASRGLGDRGARGGRGARAGRRSRSSPSADRTR